MVKEPRSGSYSRPTHSVESTRDAYPHAKSSRSSSESSSPDESCSCGSSSSEASGSPSSFVSSRGNKIRPEPLWGGKPGPNTTPDTQLAAVEPQDTHRAAAVDADDADAKRVAIARTDAAGHPARRLIDGERSYAEAARQGLRPYGSSGCYRALDKGPGNCWRHHLAASWLLLLHVAIEPAVREHVSLAREAEHGQDRAQRVAKLWRRAATSRARTR